MSDKYIAYKYYDDVQWGVVDQQGAILYEAMFDSLAVAAYVAKRHSDDDKLTWDDIAKDVEAFELSQPHAAAEPTADDGGGGVDDARRLEGLAAQIVHAQMVLQTALGYKENDYNVSLTDLVEDIEKLQAQRDAAVAALVECTTLMNNHGNDDNWETVTLEYAEAIKRGREVVANVQPTK